MNKTKKLFKNTLRKLIYKIKNAKLSTKVILIILLIIGGGMTVNHIEQKQEMIEIAKAHKKEMDQEVRYGDKDHHIKSIMYEWNTVKHNPMGGFSLQGYVNGDKNLYFGMALRSDDGGKHIYCYEYTCANKLDKWTGDENK